MDESHPWQDGFGNMSQRDQPVETIMTMNTTIMKMTIITERVTELEIVRHRESDNYSKTTRF